MDCSIARELLVYYLDGELGPDSIAQVRIHLDQCPDCSARLRREEAFVVGLRHRLLPPPPPPHLQERVRFALRSVSAPAPRSWARRPLLWGAAASILLLLGAAAAQSYIRPGGVLHALTLPESEATEVVATVVCVGCESQDAGNPVAHEHRNGLKCATGNLWMVLENDRTRDLIQRRDLWGRKVQVRGVFFHRTHAVSVSSLRYF